jgi:hypothetical protein
VPPMTVTGYADGRDDSEGEGVPGAVMNLDSGSRSPGCRYDCLREDMDSGNGTAIASKPMRKGSAPNVS